jgi:hypothetical protein
VFGTSRDQEQDQFRNILRRAGIAGRERYLPVRVFDLHIGALGVPGVGVVADVGVDLARADNVDANAMLRKLARGHLAECREASFGARIGCAASLAERPGAVDR